MPVLNVLLSLHTFEHVNPIGWKLIDNSHVTTNCTIHEGQKSQNDIPGYFSLD